MPEFDDPRLVLPPGGMRTPLQVTASSTALYQGPGAAHERASELLHGEHVTAQREENGFVLVQNAADHYVGWAARGDLGPRGMEASHVVASLRAFSYQRPSIKSPIIHTLSLGARVSATTTRDGRFIDCGPSGWMYEDQLRAIEDVRDDPAEIAARYLHTPYLWGGRDSIGIDCSGLVQMAYEACGVALPRDSDMQFAWAGEPIANWQKPGALRRGDLIFWKGHVGIMLDETEFLHGNGHHMGVASEPLTEAVIRIAMQYGEPVGARRIDLIKARAAQPVWLNP